MLSLGTKHKLSCIVGLYIVVMCSWYYKYQLLHFVFWKQCSIWKANICLYEITYCQAMCTICWLLISHITFHTTRMLCELSSYCCWLHGLVHVDHLNVADLWQHNERPSYLSVGWLSRCLCVVDCIFCHHLIQSNAELLPYFCIRKKCRVHNFCHY